MKKIVTSLLLFFSLLCFSQTAIDTVSTTFKSTSSNNIYNRELPSNLKEKYSNEDFVYKEKKINKKESSDIDLGFLNGFIVFMKFVFPFLLGGFLIYIILKTVLNIDIRFWKKQKNINNTTQKITFDTDDINEIDIETLLKEALNNNNFRLATRYYYLKTIKYLSDLKYINYQIEKTNSDYLLEIKNEKILSDFSYLSYIYNHIWYGKFNIDAISFKSVENKYQSFFKNLKE